MQAAQLAQIVPCGNPELRGKGLDQDRHQIACHHHPEKEIPELGSPFDVGGEISWIDVGDARDECGPQKRPQSGQSAPATLSGEDL